MFLLEIAAEKPYKVISACLISIVEFKEGEE